jgi:hypothetical protein
VAFSLSGSRRDVCAADQTAAVTHTP